MRSAELREKFLRYFERNGHKRVASSSLIPANDPTLFFTNAGMVQFKDVFLGFDRRDYVRATSSQKCMRVSGKHNDLENVGLTPRHHTFFEMLGNFSFGDYFKKEAIRYSWDFLVKELGVPKDRLYVTIYNDDDDAFKLWQDYVDKDRIFRFGEKDNFWAMGDAGPCGPCSEIHFDKRPGEKVKKADFETERFVEVWNLVFMQFNRTSDGKLHPLAKPSVDTGMGLERLAAIVEGVEGNYETDLFTPIISHIEKITGKKYKSKYDESARDDIAIRVIADHIRASIFLVGDGVQPSNEGRGYVLRRIIRRAIRHGRMLGLGEPFLHKVGHTVIDEMCGAYPELANHRAFIEKVIYHEEERFFETLDKGLEILDKVFSDLKKKKEAGVQGDIVFKLYDTYGFPKDLTADIALEHDMTIDGEGFERLMEEQRGKARGAWKGSGEDAVGGVYKNLQKRGIKTEFRGYEEESSKARVTAIIKGGKEVALAKEGDEIQFIVDRTPFYGESGGQAGDQGMAIADDLEINILDTKRPLQSLFVHSAKVIKGSLKVGTEISLAVDSERRGNIKRNHTATHLLHKALREVLGEHVRQAGSYVGPDRLRFDFSHFAAMKGDEIKEVEERVNDAIRRNILVSISMMKHADAVSKGALAFFGEKYGENVRVVEVPDLSMELCGGVHVSRTGDIGMLKIISEGSVAAGVRRIEAVTGVGVEKYIKGLEDEARGLSEVLKVNVGEIPNRVKKLIEQVKILEGELENARSRLTAGKERDLLSEVKEFSGVKVLSAKVDASNPKELRSMSDVYKEKIGSGIVLLGAEVDGKVALIVTVSKDLTKKYHAGNIVRGLAKIVGGTGGGRPDMAEGGGPDVSRIGDVLSKISQILRLV